MTTNATLSQSTLANAPIYASIPAQDLDRARRWYEEKLGLTPKRDLGPNGLVYRTGETRFVLYPTPYAGTGKHTLAGWNVADIDAAMVELRARWVVFEDYDGTNGPKTENGVARADGGAAAWFKDSEDNTLNLSQNPPGMSLDG
jgi:catechol 2,3-dioxygenase-like lactoylglutathione lyase family enzyme